MTVTTERALERVRAHAPTLSAGVISADLMHLASDLDLLGRAGLDVLHFDVMDGCFVPMLTIGAPFVKKVKTPLLKDVHLMIEGAAEKAGDYVQAGADIITVQVEGCHDVLGVLRDLGAMENANDPARGLIRGVGIFPPTPISVLEPLLDEMEMVVVLAIDPREKKPGFDGATADRCAAIRTMASNAGKDLLLCIDGGVTRDNIGEIAALGADLVVSGSALFAAGGPAENVPFMLAALRAFDRAVP